MSNNSDSSLLGFLLGGIVGGIIALLFAPRKGSETREAVLDFLDDIQEKSADTIKKTKQDFNDIYKEGKNFIVEEKENIVSDIKEIKSDLKNIGKAPKKTVKKTKKK